MVRDRKGIKRSSYPYLSGFICRGKRERTLARKRCGGCSRGRVVGDKRVRALRRQVDGSGDGAGVGKRKHSVDYRG